MKPWKPYSIPVGNLLEEVATRRNNTNRKSALHYCAPSGGGWGVVRAACLVPEILILFVIPVGCGRHGGIASFQTGDNQKVRYLLIEEAEVVMGSYEDRIGEAIEQLIHKEKPKGMMIFSTCIDDLLGTDFDSLLRMAEEKHQIPMVRAKMNPIMSETVKPPELMVQDSMYAYLQKKPLMGIKRERYVNTIGSFAAVDKKSEIHSLLNEAGGYQLKHITDYKELSKFQTMANHRMNLLVAPGGAYAVKSLEKKTGMSYLEVFSSFQPEETSRQYRKIEEALGLSLAFEKEEKAVKAFLEENRKFLEGKTVAIGATINARPFELAKFLVEQGMDLRYVLAKAVHPSEKSYVEWLTENAAHLQIIPNLEPSLSSVEGGLEQLDYGIGLDAAAYFDVKHLIELPFEESLYGYQGAKTLIHRLIHAKPYEGDLIQRIYQANLVI
ncbi:Nitrogenase component 1 type Oxidoreductase [Tindallia magadiensis]|uniref:Nitrogenase component 1 type Oxidoreductase n=1 Tax=Tindallia magadiensis TaxID=69895 RepID=A0A1I3GDH3_9FIRM|nr:nitrogenase component 1 [Tindallia magadiensis]SFI21536.1 Nitrogenase component 1 type Oxidoreductase [Tindallia magadiensis]